jgi:hypothetical protein
MRLAARLHRDATVGWEGHLGHLRAVLTVATLYGGSVHLATTGLGDGRPPATEEAICKVFYDWRPERVEDPEDRQIRDLDAMLGKLQHALMRYRTRVVTVSWRLSGFVPTRRLSAISTPSTTPVMLAAGSLGHLVRVCTNPGCPQWSATSSSGRDHGQPVVDAAHVGHRPPSLAVVRVWSCRNPEHGG